MFGADHVNTTQAQMLTVTTTIQGRDIQSNGVYFNSVIVLNFGEKLSPVTNYTQLLLDCRNANGKGKNEMVDHVFH